MRRLAIAATVAGLALMPACNNIPTEITPLPRAIGEVEAIYMEISQLQPLDPATQGVYVLWALTDRSGAERMTDFYVSTQGILVDATGTPIVRFTSDDFPLRKTLGLLITIELSAVATDGPTGMQILTGTFVEGVAILTVPIPATVTSSSGTMQVFTPTDGANTNENSGIWGVTSTGEPSLRLADTTAALEYETFIDVGGLSLPVGRFDVVNKADDANAYIASTIPPPDRPGEDLLQNPPPGITFPVDLSGARVSISLEGRFNDFVGQSQLVVLEAILPAGLTGGETIQMMNRTASFPSGTAILY